MWTSLVLLHSLTGSAGAAEHGVNFRFRAGFIPDGITGIWYFDSDEPGALPFERPSIGAQVFGLEYTLGSDDPGPTGIFWLERMPVRMDAGYWDDRESPPNHEDGDWLEPSDGLGAWALGANYAHELPLTDTDKPVWMSLMFGGGLGIGFASGSITRWHAGLNPEVTNDCGVAEEWTAPERHERCPADSELDLPAVVPILDFTASARVHLWEYGSVRLDLGLHDVLYLGTAVGASF
jgi:hypothetical protein